MEFNPLFNVDEILDCGDSKNVPNIPIENISNVDKSDLPNHVDLPKDFSSNLQMRYDPVSFYNLNFKQEEFPTPTKTFEEKEEAIRRKYIKTMLEILEKDKIELSRSPMVRIKAKRWIPIVQYPSFIQIEHKDKIKIIFDKSKDVPRFTRYLVVNNGKSIFLNIITESPVLLDMNTRRRTGLNFERKQFYIILEIVFDNLLLSLNEGVMIPLDIQPKIRMKFSDIFQYFERLPWRNIPYPGQPLVVQQPLITVNKEQREKPSIFNDNIKVLTNEGNGRWFRTILGKLRGVWDIPETTQLYFYDSELKNKKTYFSHWGKGDTCMILCDGKLTPISIQKQVRFFRNFDNLK